MPGKMDFFPQDGLLTHLDAEKLKHEIYVEPTLPQLRDLMWWLTWGEEPPRSGNNDPRQAGAIA